MAKSVKKKSAKAASATFHNVISASVSGNPKPKKADTFLEIKNVEKFYRRGKDYVILVVNNRGTYRGEIYQLAGIYNGKKGQSPEEVATTCKQLIDAHV